jgi:hypothetical protein
MFILEIPRIIASTPPTRSTNPTGTQPTVTTQNATPSEGDQFVSADNEENISQEGLDEAIRTYDFNKARKIARQLYQGKEKERALLEVDFAEALTKCDWNRARTLARNLSNGEARQRNLRQIDLAEAIDNKDFKKARGIARELNGRIGELEVELAEIASRPATPETRRRFMEIQIEILRLKRERANPDNWA